MYSLCPQDLELIYEAQQDHPIFGLMPIFFRMLSIPHSHTQLIIEIILREVVGFGRMVGEFKGAYDSNGMV